MIAACTKYGIKRDIILVQPKRITQTRCSFMIAGIINPLDFRRIVIEISGTNQGLRSWSARGSAG